MPPPPPPAAYGGYPAQSYAQPAYGGFWIRFVAYIVDSIIVAIPVVVISVIIGVIAAVASGNAGAESSQSATNGAGIVAELIALVITIAYFVYFWSTGQTLGMRIFKLRVVDANTGQAIGIGRAFLRYFGFLVSGAVCYIGLIWAAFDSRKQGWHDKIASTVVVQA